MGVENNGGVGCSGRKMKNEQGRRGLNKGRQQWHFGAWQVHTCLIVGHGFDDFGYFFVAPNSKAISTVFTVVVLCLCINKGVRA